ncbi:MAG: hypothetical protein IKY83_09175 [Proteobacteria bacterium]|nr:hypothetical protein [Pseudomonadota bacterium]
MMMKRAILIILLFCIPVIAFSTPAFAQAEDAEAQKDRPWLVGVNGGLSLSAEIDDLEAIGMGVHVGFDFAYPLSETFALGFYLSLGGGFMGAIHPYSEYDRFYYPFKFSAGILVEIGELRQRPFLFGAGPCAGLGFVDMDLVLPWEIRFGRFVSEHVYIMADLTYGYSLAHETVYLEPTIRVGYNFGHKKKKDE